MHPYISGWLDAVAGLQAIDSVTTYGHNEPHLHYTTNCNILCTATDVGNLMANNVLKQAWTISHSQSVLP